MNLMLVACSVFVVAEITDKRAAFSQLAYMTHRRIIGLVQPKLDQIKHLQTGPKYPENTAGD